MGKQAGEPLALLKLWRLLESLGGVRDHLGVNNAMSLPARKQTKDDPDQ